MSRFGLNNRINQNLKVPQSADQNQQKLMMLTKICKKLKKRLRHNFRLACSCVRTGYLSSAPMRMFEVFSLLRESTQAKIELEIAPRHSTYNKDQHKITKKISQEIWLLLRKR